MLDHTKLTFPGHLVTQFGVNFISLKASQPNYIALAVRYSPCRFDVLPVVEVEVGGSCAVTESVGK